MGRLLKAHGLKGAIKLELYTDSPNERFIPGAEFELQVPEDSAWSGKTVKVLELRWYNSSPILFLEGIEDRESAESLIKAILVIDKPLDELPQEPDAWYDHQLIGLKVKLDDEFVGEIIRVEHLPAQDLLIVKTENDEVMVPFVKALVPEVNADAGYLVVTPPQGLFVEEVESADEV